MTHYHGAPREAPKKKKRRQNWKKRPKTPGSLTKPENLPAPGWVQLGVTSSGVAPLHAGTFWKTGSRLGVFCKFHILAVTVTNDTAIVHWIYNMSNALVRSLPYDQTGLKNIGNRKPDDHPPTEVSNEVLSLGVQWLTIECGKSNGSIVPALLGIAKLAKVQSQSLPMPISLSLPTAPEPEPVGTTAESSSITLPYQMCQQSFSSSSGSGYTVWYSGKSNSSLLFLPTIPQAKTGHLYIHFDMSRNVSQYWMLGIGSQWQCVSPGAEYPLNHDRVLGIHSNGEPSWITRASTATTKIRKEKEM
ncbi:hypothetical protein H4582DRAFT_2052655 [Lactarius indigo]|nr:hypothetical protein H4582DRAFT_2052655 [Lactarius indigo]